MNLRAEQLTLRRRGGLVTATRDGELVRYRANTAGTATRLDDLRDHPGRCRPPGAEDRVPGAP